MKPEIKHLLPICLLNVVIVSALCLPGDATAQVVYNWSPPPGEAQGNWSEASKWNPHVVPNSNDADVKVGGVFSVVTVDGAYSVGRLAINDVADVKIADGKTVTIAQGAFSGSGTLTNNAKIELLSTGNPTELRFSGDLTIDGVAGDADLRYPASISLVDNSAASVNRIAATTPGGRLTVGPYQNIAGAGDIGLGITNITNNGEITVGVYTNGSDSGLPMIIEPGNGAGGGELINNGTITVQSGRTLQLSAASGGKFTNNGTLAAYSGSYGSSTLEISAGALTNFSGTTLTGGTYVVYGSKLLLGGGSIVTNRANIQLGGSTQSVFDELKTLADNQGSFTVGSEFDTAGDLSNSGALVVPSKLVVNGALTQSATGSMSVGSGSGTVTANSIAIDGAVLLNGVGKASLTLNGPVTLAPTTKLSANFASCELTMDHIQVNGSLSLGGTLEFQQLPGKSGSYRLIDYTGSLTGEGLHIAYLPQGTSITVDSATPGQVNLAVNLSQTADESPYRVAVAEPSDTPYPGDFAGIYPDIKNHPEQERALTCNLPDDFIPSGVATVGSDTGLFTDIYHPRMFVVRLSTGELLDTIDLSPHVAGVISVSPDDSIALAHGGNLLLKLQAPFAASSQVSVINLPAYTSSESQPLFSGTGRAFVCLGNYGIAVIEPPYDEVAFTIPNSSAQAIAASPDGETLLVTDGVTNNVAIYHGPLSASSTPELLNVPGTNKLLAIIVTPDGSTALIGAATEDRIFAISAPFTSTSAVETLPLPQRGFLGPSLYFGLGFTRAAASPDSQLAIFAGGSVYDFFNGASITLSPPFTAAGVQAKIGPGTTKYVQMSFPNPGPLPSSTPAPTVTPSPSASATPSATPTITPVPTATASPSATATITPVPTATPGSLALLNISTRMEVLSGENVLIAGFIVTGNEPKKVLIRGLGPSLPVAGQLADPTLELHQGGSLLVSNDNWRDSQEQEISDTTIPPTSDLESALVTTLSPGSYTAILAGKENSAGVGQVEVYDLSQAAVSQLANISTRGFVDTGDNVMIGGIIVGGQTSANTARVLVRAIGPSLAGQGVSAALKDTTLELRDANGSLIAQNDDWRSDQEQAIQATTIPPSDDRESALVEDLAAGNYTAIVRGKDNSMGVGLVEAYNVQ